MSDRFVSGGTIGSSGDSASAETALSSDAKPLHDAPRNKEWEAVQQELEAERRRREEQRIKAAAGEERSLYDVLQANKAAKQAAFEEQAKLSNQFRALDDDEVEFLDEVRQKKREEEEKVRRETEEGLRAFRERQMKGGGEPGAAAGAGAGAEGAEAEAETEAWGVGRKRKRVRGKEVKGVVRRRVSESGDGAEKKTEQQDGGKEKEAEPAKNKDGNGDQEAAKKPAEKKGLGGLLGYGSDSDSEED